MSRAMNNLAAVRGWSQRQSRTIQSRVQNSARTNPTDWTFLRQYDNFVNHIFIALYDYYGDEPVCPYEARVNREFISTINGISAKYKVWCKERGGGGTYEIYSSAERWKKLFKRMYRRKMISYITDKNTKYTEMYTLKKHIYKSVKKDVFINAL